MKYEYKVETIYIVGFKTHIQEEAEVQSTIDKYAKDGWKLHTLTPSILASNAFIAIFEREVK